jgi:hypothetical protein
MTSGAVIAMTLNELCANNTKFGATFGPGGARRDRLDAGSRNGGSQAAAAAPDLIREQRPSGRSAGETQFWNAADRNLASSSSDLETMHQLRSQIRGCPKSLMVKDADHFVPEWGEGVLGRV